MGGGKGEGDGVDIVEEAAGGGAGEPCSRECASCTVSKILTHTIKMMGMKKNTLQIQFLFDVASL